MLVKFYKSQVLQSMVLTNPLPAKTSGFVPILETGMKITNAMRDNKYYDKCKSNNFYDRLLI